MKADSAASVNYDGRLLKFLKGAKNSECMNRKREEKKFIEAYNQYFDGIYRYCYFRVFNADLAEDLSQETFIKTWKYIADGGSVDNMKAFLYKVALNLVIDSSRKKKPLPLDEVKEIAASVRLNNIEEGIFDKIDAKETEKILGMLDEKHRDAVVMRYVEELKPKEIAEILKEPVNTISVRIHNGLKKLRKILKEKYNEGQSNQKFHR